MMLVSVALRVLSEKSGPPPEYSPTSAQITHDEKTAKYAESAKPRMVLFNCADRVPLALPVILDESEPHSLRRAGN